VALATIDPSPAPIWAIEPSRPADPPPADRQRRRDGLEDRDPCPDVAATNGERRDDLRHTVSGDLGREHGGDQPGEEHADRHGDEHPPTAEERRPRHVQGQATDELEAVDEDRGTDAGAGTDEQRQEEESGPSPGA